MSKKKIIISIIVLILIANGIAGVKMYKIIKKNMAVVAGLDIVLTEQKDLGDWVQVTMVMTNNSQEPILDMRVGLIVKSANVIDEKYSENSVLNPGDTIEHIFEFKQGHLTGDVLNTNNFAIKLHGYVDKVENIYDFGSEGDYAAFEYKRQ